MKLIKKWWGKVENGKLTLDDQQGFMEFYKTLEGKDVELELKPKRSTYSLNQMRYLYGGVYQPIADLTGFDADELDIILKKKFWFEDRTIKDKNGKEYHVQVPATKTKMNSKELSEYIEKVRRWALSFLGINIPTPDEYYTI